MVMPYMLSNVCVWGEKGGIDLQTETDQNET